MGLTFYLLCHVRGSVLQLPKSKASVLISSMSLLTKPHCGCASCLVILRGEFKKCPHDDECGPWHVVKLIKTAASAPVTLRSAKATLDSKRRNLAKSAVVNQLIALESADDEQGFNWWLAVVSGTAFQHKGKACTTSAGVELVKDGWYLSVKYYERIPPTSTDSFVLDQKSEMVIFTGSCLALEPARAMRSRRAAGPASLMKMVNAATVALEIEASLRELSL